MSSAPAPVLPVLPVLPVSPPSPPPPLPAADALLELFIYYRVEPARAAQAMAVVHGFQRHLCASHPGLQARLLRRPGPPEAVQTWMETYRFGAAAAAPAGGAALQRQIEVLARPLAPLISGQRHVEAFVPCA